MVVIGFVFGRLAPVAPADSGGAIREIEEVPARGVAFGQMRVADGGKVGDPKRVARFRPIDLTGSNLSTDNLRKESIRVFATRRPQSQPDAPIGGTRRGQLSAADLIEIRQLAHPGPAFAATRTHNMAANVVLVAVEEFYENLSHSAMLRGHNVGFINDAGFSGHPFRAIVDKGSDLRRTRNMRVESRVCDAAPVSVKIGSAVGARGHPGRLIPAI